MKKKHRDNLEQNMDETGKPGKEHLCFDLHECVLVAPSDYDAAKKTLGTGPEGGMKIGMQR